MEEKSREQELSVREISLIRELTQIRKEHSGATGGKWTSRRKGSSV